MKIKLYTNEESEIIELGDLELGEQEASEPVKVFGRNVSGTTLRRIIISLDGEYADSIQLAKTNDKGGAIWGNAGEQIVVTNVLEDNEEFSFWTRAIAPESDPDVIGVKNFEFVVKSTTMG